MYSIEEIEEATSEFDEDRKIGQGGYGSVYYGVIGDQVCIYVINIHPFSISYCHLSKIASNTQEVAIKKMRSNKSKEFLAELKVLCKIHHINVVRNDALVFFFFFFCYARESPLLMFPVSRLQVELLGYASGDDHLYLVYEYIHNGSLSEHLHDPLLKGIQFF